MVGKARCEVVPENRLLRANMRSTSRSSELIDVRSKSISEAIRLGRKKNFILTKDLRKKGKSAVSLQFRRLENADKLYGSEMQSNDSVPALSILRSRAVRTCKSVKDPVKDVLSIKCAAKKQKRKATVDKSSSNLTSISVTDNTIFGPKSCSAGSAYDRTSTPMNAGHQSLQQKKTADTPVSFHHLTGAGPLEILVSPPSLNMSPVVALPLMNSTQQAILKHNSSLSLDSLEFNSPRILLKESRSPRCSFVETVENLSSKDAHLSCNKPGSTKLCDKENVCSLNGHKRLTRRSLATRVETVPPSTGNSPGPVYCDVGHLDIGIEVRDSSNLKSNDGNLNSKCSTGGRHLKQASRQSQKSASKQLKDEPRKSVKKIKTSSSDELVTLEYCKIKQCGKRSESEHNTTGESDLEADSGIKTSSFSNDQWHEELQESDSDKNILYGDIERRSRRQQRDVKIAIKKNEDVELEKQLLKISNINAISSDSNEIQNLNTVKRLKRIKKSPTVSYELSELFSDLEDIATNYELIIE